MTIKELLEQYQENNVVVDDLDKIGKPLAVASSLAVELVDINEDQLVKVSYLDWSIGFTITKLNEEEL